MGFCQLVCSDDAIGRARSFLEKSSVLPLPLSRIYAYCKYKRQSILAGAFVHPEKKVFFFLRPENF